jgi:hypothetical protein
MHHDGLTPISDHEDMKLPAVRTLVVAFTLLALVLPALAQAGRDKLTTDTGVVQSVAPTEITLRELDGTLVSLAVGPETRVRLNGDRARLEDVKPGFVATVVHKGTEPALAIRAFGRVALLVDRGVVTALSTEAITLRRSDGTTITIPVDRNTRFRRSGEAARRAAARPGATVSVTHPDGGAARIVNVLKRG